MVVTMADVARRAGVSKQTVSAVINGKSGISAETTARVQQIVADLDYHPNVLAGSLRNRRTAIIGLLAGDISDPFWAEVAGGVEDVAQQRGYVVVLCNTYGDQARAAAYCLALRRHQVAGVIHGPIDGVPHVMLEVPDAMDRRGGYVATAHLLDLGHRRIGCVVFDSLSSPGPGYQRSTGYRQALSDWSLPVDDDLLVVGTTNFDGGRLAARKLLAQRPIPTAIFVENEMLAFGVMSALDQEGLRVPDDVAVIAYSGTQLAGCYTPPMSTVGMPIFDLGAWTMRTLANRIEGVEPPCDAPPTNYEIVVRRSTVPGLRGERRCGLYAVKAPWAAWRDAESAAEIGAAGTAEEPLRMHTP